MAGALLLDLSTWDLAVTTGLNIAAASGDYAIAQNVATALRLFRGELWYDTSAGVPYLQQILGRNLPLNLIKAQFVAAALSVPGVKSAVCFIQSDLNRTLKAQVLITSTGGQSFTVGQGQNGFFILNHSQLDGSDVLG